MKKIYLTFDDGIEDGTLDILDLLNSHDIKATFFLTGIHIFNQYNSSTLKLKECLEKMTHGNHLICNHSFSHAFDFYTAYYSKGLLFKSDNRFSPYRDFVFNKNFILWILYKLNIKSLNHKFDIIRLPGRNSLNNSDIESINKNFLKELVKNNFKIIGWHDEWKMSYYFSEQRRNLRKPDIQTLPNFYPYINMQEEDNIRKDRLIESYDELLKRILRSDKTDNIILLHDRAFRNDEITPNRHLEALSHLIHELNDQNIKFETIDNLQL